ncbi:hypothetical protein B9Z55_004494 [Caenorhabditis nigoni]|uniref:Uncharacterized protein n=1 Tax=Caenorhabditis nigoni TaxID=1611254 RepID=A0A2G5UWS4_9PELO|nr:hypothetical protein B9Z55_004494 [Caenorhabditis nigoni]
MNHLFILSSRNCEQFPANKDKVLRNNSQILWNESKDKVLRINLQIFLDKPKDQVLRNNLQVFLDEPKDQVLRNKSQIFLGRAKGSSSSGFNPKKNLQILGQRRVRGQQCRSADNKELSPELQIPSMPSLERQLARREPLSTERLSISKVKQNHGSNHQWSSSSRTTTRHNDNFSCFLFSFFQSRECTRLHAILYFLLSMNHLFILSSRKFIIFIIFFRLLNPLLNSLFSLTLYRLIV